MFKVFKNFFDPNQQAIKQVEPIVDEILEKEVKYKTMDFKAMQEIISDFKKELAPLLAKVPAQNQISLKRTDKKQLAGFELAIQKKLQNFIPDFFAMLREINRRKFNKPHFRVQLIAATILAQGHKLTELKTGEGKTQVFHLPAALYGFTGRGSHVVTVNDYLARRDGEYAGHAMSDLGVSVGIITPQASYRFVPDAELAKTKGEEAAKERESIDIAKLSDMKGINLIECPKKDAYKQNVVYGTNNEFGFDYLRDNMVYELDKRVQKELYFCIIDEADSILIDEARTPLIISAPAEASNDLYERFAILVKQLSPEKHYVVDEKTHSATLTEDGVVFAEKLLNVQNIWEDYALAHHLDNALKAETLYKLDDEYIIKNGEVLIVDEFTGRVLAGRRYSDGLHQAIEAKEKVEVKRESKTMATITFQNFFRLYKIFSGGSGTIMTEAEEFLKIYDLESYSVPTNMPVIRKDKNDKVYKHKEAKFNAVAEEIMTINKEGRPILVGTTSVDASEFLSRKLDKKGIKHEVLNAKYHEREAQIIARAGEKNSVTVATNMAGRGTDIPLGAGVDQLGGLAIIGTERHEARRVDNQLRGRSGRQGEQGSSQFFVALDDEIMRIQGGEIIKRLMEMTNIPDDFPIEAKMIGRSIESAQKKMEGQHFDIRKHLVEYDDVMNQQREIFYSRRHRILEQAEKIQKEKDSATIAEIEATFQEILKNEIENITYKHLINEKESKNDYQNLIQEYFDLANDDEILGALHSIDIASASTIKSRNTLSATLISQIDKKDPETVIKHLIKITNIIVAKKITEFAENLGEIYKITSLQVMDQLWTEHLDMMGDLREGINLRGYAQRDPLTEYKNEGYVIFEKFIETINSQIARRILKIRKVISKSMPFEQLQTNESAVSDILTGTREMSLGLENTLQKGKNQQAMKTEPQKTIRKSGAEIGRNDPCPCGSGLKYKKCGLINAPGHKE
ncbi:MAG: SEC-C metal-binding domain-containing protein [bacterium]